MADAISYDEFVRRMEAANEEGNGPISGVIVYDQSNWKKQFSLESRSYVVSSDCKRFKAGMIGNSMFGSSLDGSDLGVRLDMYDWKVDYCYML